MDGIISLTLQEEDDVTGPEERADKVSALRRHHALNPRPDRVRRPRL